MPHLAQTVEISLVRLLDGIFLAGMAGCAFVLVLTFIEDLKTLIHG